MLDDGSAAMAHALPATCAVCRLACARRVCLTCVEREAPARPRCRRCALPLPLRVDRCVDCLRDPPPFDAAVAACDYRFPWDELVDDFKSHDALDRADALAELLCDAIRRDDAATSDPIVVPVPCSRERVRERGYNPAWEIARRVARRLHLDSNPDALRRIVHTPPQRGLTRAERMRNLRGAFDVAPGRRSMLHGRRIALVDDVMTTTATTAEAARALLAAGARDVHVWVAARTPRPDD
jgi:ComF family protein